MDTNVEPIDPLKYGPRIGETKTSSTTEETAPPFVTRLFKENKGPLTSQDTEI